MDMHNYNILQGGDNPPSSVPLRRACIIRGRTGTGDDLRVTRRHRRWFALPLLFLPVLAQASFLGDLSTIRP